MFENRAIEGIYMSRFVASWVNKGGKLNWMFEDWLRSLTINGRKLTDEEVRDIYNFGTNGKLELETNAKNFLNSK